MATTFDVDAYTPDITEPLRVDFDEDTYPALADFTAPLPIPTRTLVGRSEERVEVLASLARPELSNVLLLGPAGVGKTSLVQSVMTVDPKRAYVEVDVSRMAADIDNPEELGARIKDIFDEAELYANDNDVQLVMFMDEFHQLIQISQPAVEALKPVLAASGTRGILIIGATTFEEYNQFIAPNQALTQRLQRLNLDPPGRDNTVKILQGMAEKYGVDHLISHKGLYEEIYELTERYVPSAVQPRKSILILDAMIGWSRVTGLELNHDLLARVISNSLGMDISLNVDGSAIKRELDKRVFSQDLATTMISRRLQVCVADLHDKTRPMGSFLLSGSTGTGKTELTKQMGNLLFGENSNRLIRFDMSEFSDENVVTFFKNEITQQVFNYGHGIVLLDEIDKAHPAVIRLLYQILDDGRLTDQYNRQVSFLNTYIVMTTNKAEHIYESLGVWSPAQAGDRSEVEDYLSVIETALRNNDDFPSALLGRIDVLAPVMPLSDPTKEKITMGMLRNIQQEVWTKHAAMLDFDKKVVPYILVDRGNTDKAHAGGARDTKRTITNEILAEIAAYINEHDNVDRIIVDIEGKMRYGNPDVRNSKAYPVVKEYSADADLL